jgi:hypothetical protein
MQLLRRHNFQQTQLCLLLMYPCHSMLLAPTWSLKRSIMLRLVVLLMYFTMWLIRTLYCVPFHVVEVFVVITSCDVVSSWNFRLLCYVTIRFSSAFPCCYNDFATLNLIFEIMTSVCWVLKGMVRLHCVATGLSSVLWILVWWTSELLATEHLEWPIFLYNIILDYIGLLVIFSM